MKNEKWDEQNIYKELKNFTTPVELLTAYFDKKTNSQFSRIFQLFIPTKMETCSDQLR